jgi:hypothetical protein
LKLLRARESVLWGLFCLAASAPLYGQAPDNLLQESRVQGIGVGGSSASLAGGLLPEGSKADSEDSVFFTTANSYVVVDLGRRVEVRGLALQGDNAAAYLLESSLDGFRWRPVWNVPTRFVGIGLPPMGLRTRHKTLAAPLVARYLRLRLASASATAESGAPVSRLWAVSQLEDNWPPALDYSRPRSRPPLFPRIDLSAATILSIFLASWALVVFTWLTASERRGEATAPRGASAAASDTYPTRKRLLLAATMLMAVLAWPNFMNFHWGSFYHPHEVFHYLLGARYPEELRYLRLYDCALIADAENSGGGGEAAPRLRDLSTNAVVSSGPVLGDPQRCLSRFTDDRWRDFREDVAWLKQRLPGERAWHGVFLDHGFNASPAWLILGRPLSGVFPLSDLSVTLLTFLDVALLLACALLLWRAFGFEAAALAVVFFCLNPIAFFRYTGGSLLRYDWFFWLVVGLVSLRRGNQKLAGFSLVYSTLLRVFPGAILLGLGIRIAAEIRAVGSLGALRRYRGLLIGAMLGLVIVMPLSLLAAGRGEAWNEFAANSAKHLQVESTNFMGLAPLLRTGSKLLGAGDEAALGSPETGGNAGAAAGSSAAMAAIRGLLVIGAVTLFFFATRGRPLWVSAVLAIGLIPLLTTLSNYYYVVLACYGALWPVSRRAGWTLAALSWATWLPMALLNQRELEYWTASLLTLVFVVAAMILVRRDSQAQLAEGLRW